MKFKIVTDARQRVVHGSWWVRFAPLLLVLISLPWHNFNLPFNATENLETTVVMCLVVPTGCVIAAIRFPVTVLTIDRYADTVMIDVWYIGRSRRASFALTDVTRLAMEKTEMAWGRSLYVTYPAVRLQLQHENGTDIYPDEFIPEGEGSHVERIANWIAKARWGNNNWRDVPNIIIRLSKTWG